MVRILSVPAGAAAKSPLTPVLNCSMLFVRVGAIVIGQEAARATNTSAVDKSSILSPRHLRARPLSINQDSILVSASSNSFWVALRMVRIFAYWDCPFAHLRRG